MPEERNDARQLSPVLENYLEIIFHQEIREGAARASSIAEAAGVSRSTVTSTLKALKSMGYVDYEPYSLVHLTEAGMHIGRDIAHRHIVIQEFFQHILQLEPNVSNDVACELEHVIPPSGAIRPVPAEPRGRLEKLAGGLQRNPAGAYPVQYGQGSCPQRAAHARHAHPDDGAGRTAEKVPLAGFILRVGRALRRREKPCKTSEANALRVASPSAGKRGNVKAR